MFRAAFSAIFGLLVSLSALAAPPAAAQAVGGAEGLSPPEASEPARPAPPLEASGPALPTPALPEPPPPPTGRPRVTLESAWLVADEASGQLRIAAVEPPGNAEQRLYTGRFRHDGIIVVTGLEVVLEVPAGMHYMDGSATGPGAHVTFSVDGGRNFAPPGALHVTTDYTHIRYELPGEYPPGTAGLVSFRARPAAAPIGDNDAP